jgi:protein arginine kinase
MNELSQLAERQAPWIVRPGPERDIDLISRVRLARNLENDRFSHITPADELCTVRERVISAAQAVLGPEGSLTWRMEDLEELERRFLVERHLISIELMRYVLGRGLVITSDESTGLMVNEEDHLRLQAFAPGLAPRKALARALDLASGLEEHVQFAFDDELGFLTACPTNVGTGMRASLLMHLPGLRLTEDIDRVLNSLRRLSYEVRGFYGEGSDALASLFQVSHSVTLGRSEDEIIEELLHHAQKVISCERRARSVLLQRDRVRLEDRLWRAWGLLGSCRLLATSEAFALLSDVRLGSDLKVLPDLDDSILNTLLISVQSAHLQVAAGRPIEAPERDEIRAAAVREQLRRAARKDEDR